MEKEVKLNSTNITEDERIHFRLWLQRQLTERCKRNPRYSLRAFAKMLAMDHSSLSQILSGKRSLSKKAMQNLCTKLSATPKDLRGFGLLERDPSDETYFQLDVDSFSVIADWYHAAIMELTYVQGFKSDAKWIARKLSITVEEAKAATERLIRLKLLVLEQGTLKKTSRQLTNQSSVITSAAHREFQTQIVEKALSAIQECDSSEKDITSMTMAIDEKNLAKARELTKKYRRDLCALLEDGEPTRVYNLGIQLYPVSKKEENL